MWKYKKQELTELPERRTGCGIRKCGMMLVYAFLWVLLCGMLGGCGQENAAEPENPDMAEQISRIGLILTSRDDSENEEV